ESLEAFIEPGTPADLHDPVVVERVPGYFKKLRQRLSMKEFFVTPGSQECRNIGFERDLHLKQCAQVPDCLAFNIRKVGKSEAFVVRQPGLASELPVEIVCFNSSRDRQIPRNFR